ncbi:hypothetical protein RM697_03470 [Ichthyenterobacterium sp. W332]|uniref:Uncharacterized protein n=1 Tax=Microcosmobacter mediterraneus TaxID=3075607 RepID=A0ABU2YHP2_9FLAO|nr:hypothetical protein [Ichthyenterobacterium sp. W332]MDT0557689.1 hypothetical protein [Ichthyenterobacterium sp. W332]
MNKESFIDCERNRILSVLNFRLPYYFKYIGAVLVVSFFSLILLKSQFPEHIELMRNIGRKVFVIGLLCISLARDKEEDEMTNAIRLQSYTIAFILGVIYAVIMPYVEFGVSNAVQSGGESFKDLGDFQVLSFMFLIQLGFYYTLKRNR